MVGPRKDAAIRLRVAAIIYDGDALLMARHEKDGRSYWLLPGGGVEYGESVEAALIRELQEEAGLRIRVEDLVCVHDSIPPDGHRHVVNLYFTAAVVDGTLACHGDERLKEMRFVPVRDLADLTVYPDIRAQLLPRIVEGRLRAADYLGNIWKD